MSESEGGKGNFIDRCLRGEVLPEQIDQFVEDWHARSCPVDLSDYLGMDWEEYLAWIMDPALLSLILIAHKEHRAFADVVATVAQTH